MSNDELQKAIDDITTDATLTGASDDASDNEGTTVELPAEMNAAPTEEVSKEEEDALAKQLAELQNGTQPEPAGANEPDLSNNPFVGNVIEEQPAVDTISMMATIKPMEDVPVSSPEAPEALPTPEAVLPSSMDVLPPVEAPMAVENKSEMPSMDANANLNEAMNAVNAEVPMPEISATPNADADLEQIKNDALVELYPLLATMKVNVRQKFDICMKVYDKTGDKGALAGALSAAKEMSDDEKGDALMKIIEKIG